MLNNVSEEEQQKVQTMINELIEKAKKTDIYIPILIAIYTGMRHQRNI